MTKLDSVKKPIEWAIVKILYDVKHCRPHDIIDLFCKDNNTVTVLQSIESLLKDGIIAEADFHFLNDKTAKTSTIYRLTSTGESLFRQWRDEQTKLERSEK